MKGVDSLSFYNYGGLPHDPAIGIAIAAFGGALGQGMGLKSAVEGIARNPESSGKVTVTMLIGLALIESLVIYALVVALILIYAHPQAGTIAALFGAH